MEHAPRLIATFLDKRYPQLQMKSGVDGDGDNGIMNYLRSVSQDRLNLGKVEQMLKIGMSVSQHGGKVITTAVHEFVDFYIPDKTTKAILKRMINHPTFDPTVKNMLDETPQETAARKKKYAFVKMFQKHPFTADDVKAAVNDVVSDVDKIVDAMEP